MSIKIISAMVALLIGLVAGLPDGSAATKDKRLRIGVDGAYPPFSHRNIDGEFSGLDIDLANALCLAMKVDCALVQFDWENLIAAVRGGKVDMVIAAVDINNETLKLVDMSDPYLQLPTMVVVKTGSIISGAAPSDLNGKNIGVTKSTPHAEYLRSHLPQVNAVQYEQNLDYYRDLANGQLDAVAGNALVLSNWLLSEPGKDCCRLLATLPHDPQINGTGTAIAVGQKNTELLERVNETLKVMKKAGSIDKIIRTYFPFLK